VPVAGKCVGFQGKYNPKLKLNELFSEVRFGLINKLESVLKDN